MALISRRPMGAPRTTNVGVEDRLLRYKVAELCAEATPEVIAFWIKVLRNEPVPVYVNGEPMRTKNGKVVKSPRYSCLEQLAATDRLMERAYGRPVTVAEVSEQRQELSVKRIEIRWMPADPSDRSNRIPPEPD